MRRFPLVLMCALMLAEASVCTAQVPIFHKKKPVDKSTDSTNTAEPDKILYDRGVDDIKHGRNETGRLAMQTLINTYPDSEYLAKAKLAIADSYYKEGGSSNITQAIAGYKDFIVFFPFLPEAAYAQMQVAMCNYNEMPKADRDNSHAKAAEDEFQIFLSKYPKDPLAPEAQQRLREVQEVLAEAQFRIAYYYYIKGDKRAAAGRLVPLVHRYPLYSKTDQALWMLGDIFEKSERKDIAGGYYATIVKNYPLSKYDADAKAKLVAFGVPVPQPDPKAVAWMTAEQNTPRPKESLIHKSRGILHSGPDVDTAAHNGTPQMEPENESVSAGDILGGTGGSSGIGSGKGTNSIVGTVSPGQSAPASSTAGSAEDVNTGPAPATETPASTDGSTPAATTAPPANGDGTAGGVSAATDGSSATDAGAKTDGATAATAPTTDTANQKESSSKKKGIKKFIPW
ncbi:MAG TPA: outer membrane protein assembly factor BamD [Candidatus Acidoferrum sp.]